MTPPMMNSINSVSTTRKKREAERSVNWTEEETQVLLCAWSDERVQKSLAENLRNRHVFKHLSTRMNEMGFCRSPHQCRLRVKTLKANYVRTKLKCGIDESRSCGFKYFAEMDAVLGRRKTEGVTLPFPISSTNSSAKLCHSDRAESEEQDLYSNLEDGGHRFDSTARTERLYTADKQRCVWSRLDSDIKTEDGEISTDEFEFIDTEFPSKDQRQHTHTESGDQPQIIVSPVENCLRSASSDAIPPPAPRGTPPLPHIDSPSLNSALGPLLETFQQLTSETRLLMEQLERQRQDQARWQQEVLREWLQREERRQRETAEREERQEKARMEHQVRVLELLTGLIRENGCKCGVSITAGASKCGENHAKNAERS